MLRIYGYVVGEVATNVYIVLNEETRDCVVIDPAAHGEKLIEKIQAFQARPVAILLTHGHFDHIMAVPDLVERYHIPVYASEAEREVLRDPDLNLSGMGGMRPASIVDFRPLHEGDVLDLLGSCWYVMETPGHTVGSICFYLPNTVDAAGAAGDEGAEKDGQAAGITASGKDALTAASADAVSHPVLFSGDTLFHGSFGRTDFPGGSGRQLYQSITEKLFKLPNETEVYAGHEGDSTIGFEKMYNPIRQMGMWV